MTAKPSPDERAEKALVLARRLAERAYPPFEGESVTRISLRLVAQEVLAESAAALLQAEEALAAIKADAAYQNLHGAPHFTSAPTEIEWKAESRVKARKLLHAALATIRALVGGESR